MRVYVRKNVLRSAAVVLRYYLLDSARDIAATSNEIARKGVGSHTNAARALRQASRPQRSSRSSQSAVIIHHDDARFDFDCEAPQRQIR